MLSERKQLPTESCSTSIKPDFISADGVAWTLSVMMSAHPLENVDLFLLSKSKKSKLTRKKRISFCSSDGGIGLISYENLMFESDLPRSAS